MTTLVLVILGAIWAAVILVPLFRARTDGTLGNSIGRFRHHLSVLERTAPRSVHPAFRLREPSGPFAIPPYRPRPGSAMAIGQRSAPWMRSAAAIHRRRQAQRRRRDVLLALLVGMAGSLLLGMVHGLRVMLLVHVAFDVCFVAYLALLIRRRGVAAERDRKVSLLAPGPPAPGVPAVALAANAPAPAAGYGDGVGYGLPASY